MMCTQYLANIETLSLCIDLRKTESLFHFLQMILVEGAWRCFSTLKELPE